MKGQYGVVLEVMFILIGVMMTAYVITTFRTMQVAADATTINDNFNAAANNVLTGVVKVSSNNNSLVRIRVPDKISNHVYKILLDGQNNVLMLVSLSDRSINVTRQIFNISSDRIIKSEVVSSSVIIEAVNEGDIIRIRRPPGFQLG